MSIPEQIETAPISTRAIMNDPLFAVGFNDALNGRPFDTKIADDDENWAYERGRLLAFIIPLDCPLFIDSKLNPRAVRLCEAAFDRRLLI